MPKVLLILLSLAGFLTVIILGEVLFESVYKYPKEVKYGVTFSPKFAQDLKLDWKATYTKMLTELKVKNVRIPSYWEDLQKDEGKDDFSSVDFMVTEAEKKGVNLILVLGIRQPRWPECHLPDWAQVLTVQNRQQKILQFIKKVVQRYQDKSSIKYWQVENEPMLDVFGSGCDRADVNFLKSEVNLVRSLDKRQIIVTDSGELGSWVTPMRLSDVFGTTLYRLVYNSITGYTPYPYLPYFYNLKSALIHLLSGSNNKKTIVIELQSEPWSHINDLPNTPIDQQIKQFSLDKFKANINYAKKAGFDENYLWGVEWWFWMSQSGHPEYLEYAKTLFH